MACFLAQSQSTSLLVIPELYLCRSFNRYFTDVYRVLFLSLYFFFPFSTKSLVSIGVSIGMGVDWVGLSHKSWHLVQLSIKGRMMEFLGGVEWSRRLVSTVSGRTFEQTRHTW